MKYRRVNLYSGPGSGKSVATAWLWSELKIAGYSIEHVPEWVKRWAYEKRPIESFDEIYSFAKQMSKEELYLKAGVDLIISDSPLVMVGAYSEKHENLFSDELFSLARKFESIYPSINLFINRGDIEYQTAGRYETYEQALKMDKFIERIMGRELKQYCVCDTKNRAGMLNYIVDQLAL